MMFKRKCQTPGYRLITESVDMKHFSLAILHKENEVVYNISMNLDI